MADGTGFVYPDVEWRSMAEQVWRSIGSWGEAAFKSEDPAMTQLVDKYYRLDLSAPSQLSYRGVPLDGSDMSADELLGRQYELRLVNEDDIRRLTHLFWMKPSNVAFTLPRLLGWRNQYLSDEIEWLKANGASAHDPEDDGEEFKADPRYAQISWMPKDVHYKGAGFWRVCGDIQSLQGITFGQAIRAIENTFRENGGMELWARESAEGLHPYDPGKSGAPQQSEDEKLRDLTPAERKLAEAYTAAYLARPCVDEVFGIDIETTGTSPLRDYIIDVGCEKMHLHGPDDEGTYEQRRAQFGVPDTREELGNPAEFVSRISTKQLHGLPQFRMNRGVQKYILDQVSRMPLVAHNARFEDSWFMQNVRGYAELKKHRKDAGIIDSMMLSRRLDDGRFDEMLGGPKTDNKLDSYAHRWGDLTEDQHERHLGYEDTHIMLVAMRRHLRALGVNPVTLHA